MVLNGSAQTRCGCGPRVVVGAPLFPPATCYTSMAMQKSPHTLQPTSS